MSTEKVAYLGLLKKEAAALERIAKALEFLVEDAKARAGVDSSRMNTEKGQLYG